MFRKLLPVLALGLWCVSGSADDSIAKNCDKQCDPCGPCAAPCAPACPKPCPAPAPKPQPCPQTECKPCCEPKPKCVRCSPCPIKECKSDCNSVYGSADFLYWRSENHGLSYAWQTSDPTSGQDNRKIIHVNPSWDPGFRLGFGWNTTHDNWDLFANWTWYHNSSSDNLTHSLVAPGVGVNDGFFPLYPVSNFDTGCYQHVTANWKLKLNAIDAEMGRGMFITKCLGLRPHLGLRAAWLDQKFHDHFDTPSDLAFTTTEFLFTGFNKYWGIGPRAGLNAEWHMTHGFSFLGKTSASVLYGKTRAKSQSSSVDATLGGTQFAFYDNFWQLVPNLQLLLGVQWDTCFRCDTMFFSMSLAWETNFWWDQCNLPVSFWGDGLGNALPTVGNQALTMEGLTVNFELDF